MAEALGTPEAFDDTRKGVREAVEQLFSDQQGTLDLARDVARLDPDYAEESRRIADDLFGDDEKARQAFLFGTELPHAFRRQTRNAQHMRELLEAPLEQEKTGFRKRLRSWRRIKRTNTVTHAAVLSIGAAMIPVLKSKSGGDA